MVCIQLESAIMVAACSLTAQHRVCFVDSLFLLYTCSVGIVRASDVVLDMKSGRRKLPSTFSGSLI